MLDPVLRDVHLVVGTQVQRRAPRLQAPEAALGFRLPQQLHQPPPLQLQVSNMNMVPVSAYHLLYGKIVHTKVHTGLFLMNGI